MCLGIDPGLTGAIALIDGERMIRIWDMPVTEKTTGKGKEVNSYLLSDLIVDAMSMADRGLLVAKVEQVAAMPGQGVSSMFSFGYSAGVVSGVLGSLGVNKQMVRPQAWKRSYGLTGRDKDASRTLAIERYPEAAPLLARKKDVGRADALLIAGYQPK
ncbi:MAG: hypothetical protein WBP44_07140 [Gammaproteobacteria bacterium]